MVYMGSKEKTIDCTAPVIQSHIAVSGGRRPEAVPKEEYGRAGADKESFQWWYAGAVNRSHKESKRAFQSDRKIIFMCGER